MARSGAVWGILLDARGVRFRSLQLLRAPHRRYRLAQQEGLGDLQDFYWTSLAEAKRTGTWSGTALELWLALFAANRAIRHGGYEPGGEYRRQLDELCHTLTERLAEGRQPPAAELNAGCDD